MTWWKGHREGHTETGQGKFKNAQPLVRQSSILGQIKCYGQTIWRDQRECQTYKGHGEGQTNTKVKQKLVQNKKVNEKVSGIFSVYYDELFCLDFDKLVFVVDDRREDEAAVEFPSQSAPATSWLHVEACLLAPKRCQAHRLHQGNPC